MAGDVTSAAILEGVDQAPVDDVTETRFGITKGTRFRSEFPAHVVFFGACAGTNRCID